VDEGARLRAVPRSGGGGEKELYCRNYSLAGSRLDEEVIPAFC
jgi:hypothetical protein